MLLTLHLNNVNINEGLSVLVGEGEGLLTQRDTILYLKQYFAKIIYYL